MNAQQFDIFDLMYDRFMFEKDKPIRTVELFSGIGFQRMGMEKFNIPHEVVAVSEIDKFAIEAYEAIHGKVNNLGNIMEIKGKDIPKQIDLMTYSFPCTDLSKAGQQNGMGEETNSGLVYEVIRILDELNDLGNLPQVLLMENVVDLIQAKFVQEFNSDIQRPLELLGYTNYVITMNARDYGVAQNRNRVFMISILGEYNYVEPIPFKLEKRLIDYLEDDVDEKYFLSDVFIKGITMENTGDFNRAERFEQCVKDDEDWQFSNTVTTREGNVATSTSLNIKEDTVKGYKEAYDGDGVYIDRPHQKRGVVQSGMIQTLKTTNNDVGVVVGSYDYGSSENFMKNKSRLEPNATISRAIITSPNVGVAEAKDTQLRIRKLTPRETGRLMGMNDKQINKQLAVVSNSQAYKQHGNGIVADVIGYVIGMMYYGDMEELRKMIE